MASLADLRTAGAIQQQVRTRNLQNASELVESVSPYLTLTELESEKYGSIDKDNFTKLYEKEPDKILSILNSSPTATTYTDINTGEKAKGKIVNIREQDGKITFDIQGKQGIVPKTLGFSNFQNLLWHHFSQKPFHVLGSNWLSRSSTFQFSFCIILI